MTSIIEKYRTLLSLTQLFLLREYSLKESKKMTPETFQFFQKQARLPPFPVTDSKVEVKRPQIQDIPLPKAIMVPPPIQSRIEPPSVVVASPKEPLPNQTPQPEKAKKNQSDSKSKIDLEPMTPPQSTVDFQDYWQLFPTLFPQLALCETIPNDAYAQRIKNSWVKADQIPEVMILSFNETEKTLSFLKNIAQAISLRLAPASVISASGLEKEKKWENILASSHLRLIIVNDYALYLQPHLMSFYREIPQEGKHFLNQIPLLLLSDLSLYLKEPSLKALLWRAICNEFSASQRLSRSP